MSNILGMSENEYLSNISLGFVFSNLDFFSSLAVIIEDMSTKILVLIFTEVGVGIIM